MIRCSVGVSPPECDSDMDHLRAFGGSEYDATKAGWVYNDLGWACPQCAPHTYTAAEATAVFDPLKDLQPSRMVAWTGVLRKPDDSPIPLGVQRVRRWLKEDERLLVMAPIEEHDRCRTWCREHLGEVPEVIDLQNPSFRVYDCRVRQMVPGTGLTFQEWVVTKLMEEIDNLPKRSSAKSVLERLLTEVRER